jgi:hypothetical protein
MEEIERWHSAERTNDWKSIFWKKYNLIFHSGMERPIIAAAAFDHLIGTLGNPFWENSPTVLDRTVSPAEQKVERYRGEWEIPESKTSSHHGSIGRGYESDKWTLCIKCHGPAPHSRTPKERDFLNMHSLFMSCYICHIRDKRCCALLWLMDTTSGILI